MNKKIVWIYSIAGSILGIIKCINDLYGYSNVSIKNIITAIFLFIYSINGLFSLKALNSRRVYYVLHFIQIMQVFSFAINGFEYSFCAGASLKLGYLANNLYFTAEPLVAEYLIGINILKSFFCINFAPIIFLYLTKDR